MPPKKGRKTDPLPRNTSRSIKKARASLPLSLTKTEQRKRKAVEEEYATLPKVKQGKKQESSPPASSEDEQSSREDRASSRKRWKKEADDDDEGEEKEELLSNDEADEDEAVRGRPDETVDSSPGGETWAMKECLALASRMKSMPKKPSKNDEIFKGYMKEFEVIYTEAEGERSKIITEECSLAARSDEIERVFQGILGQLKDETANIKRFSDSFRARNTAIFNYQDPYEAFFQTHKPLIEALKEASRTCDRRPQAIHSATTQFEKAQRESIKQQDEKAKINLDARNLVRGARKFLKAARG